MKKLFLPIILSICGVLSSPQMLASPAISSGFLTHENVPDSLKTDEVKPGYEQYEQEDVAGVRFHTTFLRPVGKATPDTTVEIINQDISVSKYFVSGNSSYIDADFRLGVLLTQHIASNKRIDRAAGYRIQIFSGSERNTALEAKSRFLDAFPDIPSYLVYVSPTYRVRVGNYLDKATAMAALTKLRYTFGDALIVPDEVMLPKYKN
jgi:hypothetical protein